MKILLINGSPKGKRSNSLKLAYSFIEGFKNGCTDDEESISIDELHVASMNIAACKGCFACWQKTPGICCIKDDMQKVIGKLIDADLILWSFPLYYFNVPGILKNLIDRQLPMNLPFMSSKQNGYGSGSHDSRYDMEGKRHVLISTCGFYSAVGNYDSVLRMFDHFLGKGNYTTIFCGQGELFRVKELSARTDEYLSTVKCAGSEYAMTGTISEETDAILHTLLYSRDVFEKWQMPAGASVKQPEKKNRMILYLPGKWPLFIIKMPTMEKTACLRFTLLIWITPTRFNLARQEAKYLLMDVFLQLLA